MSEFPEGWFHGTQGKDGGNPGSGDPTVDLPVRRPPARSPARSPAQPGSAWPEQPPPSSSGRGRGAAPGSAGPGRPGARGLAGGPPPPGGRGGSRPGSTYGGTGFTGSGGGRAWLRPRRIFAVLVVLVALILVGSVVTYFSLNGKLTRKDVLVSYSGEPAQGAGSNWLIAGSDSRQGLNAAQERKLSTGANIGGQRSDTIMILHMPASGKPVLISVPRDSWVNIPGYGFNKINAAYSFGGPRLLADTVQNATGLRIDHYMEIGFGGFVNVVDAVGGVRMCIKYPLHDTASGLNISKGCQTLDGAQALGYVRDRHTFAGQDLQRIQDQRLFLKALLSKLTSTGVLVNPFASIPAASGAAGTLTVDQGTNLFQLAEAAFALRHPETTTVPIGNANFLTPTGEDAVLWDRTAALSLFSALNDGKPVPKGLITGSSQAG